MSLHVRIITLLKQLYDRNPNPKAVELELDDVDSLIRRYFVNFRGADPDHTRGLRLSLEGLFVMKLYFKHYTVTLDEGYQLKSYHLLYLDRTAKMPWHVENHFLTLFEPELAMRAKLVGDLEILKDAFAPGS